jgi:ribosomal RNA-processing protein 12
MLVNGIVESGRLELETKSGDINAISVASVRLLPVMFKLITDANTSSGKAPSPKDSMDICNNTQPNDSDNSEKFQKFQVVTEAISAMSRLAPEDFLHGLFKKVMHRLLEDIQSDECDDDRLCSLLTLSQALVGSKALNESSISFLYRSMKPLIKTDEHSPRVQKRAYKVLAEICEQYHSVVTDPVHLQEISALLARTITSSHIAARHMRLKCMGIIVNGLDSSQSNQMVRKNATKQMTLVSDRSADLLFVSRKRF